MSEEEGQTWQDFLDFAYLKENVGIEINSLLRAFLTEKLGNARRKHYRKEVLKY